MDIKIVDGFGRVVIPGEIRRKFNLKAGTKVTFINADNGVVVCVVDKNYFESLAGVLRFKGKQLKALMDGKQHTTSFPHSGEIHTPTLRSSPLERRI